MTPLRNYRKPSSAVLAIFVVLCALSLSIILLKTPHAFAQVRDERSPELRLDMRTSERVPAQSVALPAPTGSFTTESIRTMPNIEASTPQSDLAHANDAETSNERQVQMNIASSSSSFTLNDLGSQIKYCIVFPFLNSFGPPIPTFHVPVCPNATTTLGSGGNASTSITTGTLTGTVIASLLGTSTSIATGTLGGTVIASSEGTLSGTVASSSGGGSLSGTVVAPSTANGGSSGGGGGSGGGRSGSSAGSGNSPSGVRGGNPVSEVLGTSTSIPGVPNTGAGGEAVRTMFSLLLFGLAALSGAWCLSKNRKLPAL